MGRDGKSSSRFEDVPTAAKVGFEIVLCVITRAVLSVYVHDTHRGLTMIYTLHISMTPRQPEHRVHTLRDEVQNENGNR